MILCFLLTFGVLGMENEDRFKLGRLEAKEKLGDLSPPEKNNKGEFYRAYDEKSKKLIYFLGTLHINLPDDFTKGILQKVQETLGSDGVESIGTLWQETCGKIQSSTLPVNNLDHLYFCGLCNKSQSNVAYLDETLSLCSFAAFQFWNEMLLFMPLRYFFKTTWSKLRQGSISPKFSKSLIEQEFLNGNGHRVMELATVNSLDSLRMQINTTPESAGWRLCLEHRNASWVKKLLSNKSEVQFVIAGCCHGWYKTGVLMLLRKEGFQLEQMDLNLDQNIYAPKNCWKLNLRLAALMILRIVWLCELGILFSFFFYLLNLPMLIEKFVEFVD